MESNQIEYGGSNWNKEAIRNYTRAQFVEHLRSQFLPELSLAERAKRESAAGDLWDICQPPKQETKKGKDVTISKERIQSLDNDVSEQNSDNGGN